MVRISMLIFIFNAYDSTGETYEGEWAENKVWHSCKYFSLINSLIIIVVVDCSAMVSASSSMLTDRRTQANTRTMTGGRL